MNISFIIKGFFWSDPVGMPYFKDQLLYFNPFLAIQDKFPLLSHLLIIFGSLYFKQYGPRSDCCIRNSLIRVHKVFASTGLTGVHLNMCSRLKKQTAFSKKNYW